jgi:LPXTG-motif cell wall-anchored protein
MQQTLLNGYVLSYTVKATGTSTNVAADGLPTYSAAFLGNNGAGYTNNYQGIPGKPALYQHSAGTTVLTLTGISLKKSGVAVTGFALVGADAESTDSGESITWTSDKVLTSIGALGNACGGTLVMSSGNTVATCNAGPVANKTGAAIMYTLDPGTFSQTMVGSGLQAVAFGVMVSGLQLNKQIVNQLPGDQFRISVARSVGTVAATAVTDLSTGSAATEQVYTISNGASQTFTLSEAPLGSTLAANYATTWDCTKNGQPFTPTGASANSKTAAVTMNDFVQCTITNTGPALTLRKSVDTTAGGALTPASWTLAATKSGSAAAITEAPSHASSTVGKVTTASTATVAVPVGSYTLGESSTATGAAWYAASSWACTIAGGGNAPLSGNSVTVAAGNNVTCTITNTAIPPTIILRKSTVGAAAGPFSFALTNTFQAVGTVTTTAADTRTQVDGDTVTAGVQPFTASTFGTAVTIDEPLGSMPAGWVLGSATCSNGATTVGSLTGTTYTIPAPELVRGAVITCDFTNRPIAGTATWSKVDAGSTATLLRGSEWTLTGPSYPTATTIVDCTASPCAGPDKDPIAGQFSVAVLYGSYTLFEKTAPVGFQLDSTTPHGFSVSTDGVPVAGGAIPNSRLIPPALPLTGGASSEAFLLAGATLIAAAAIAGWRHRRRLLRSL